MRFRFAAALAVLCLLAGLGCGLLGGGEGGDGDGEIGLMEFEHEEDDLESTEEIVRSLSLKPEVLVKVRYLYGHQVGLESIEQLNRDLRSLLEYGGAVDVNLEWVIEVHEVTAEADELFRRLSSQRVPESQRELYSDLFIGLLDSIQVMGYGSDRILAASIKVGPSGRTLATMSDEDSEEFETLVREAGFYLTDAEQLIQKQISNVEEIIGGLRLR